ncbi:MAG TPA: hypothetical protein VEP90_20560 [Methylomirabilota bacterium]|nr:hypothetical protein [Methylomirabilota bacterium]
MLKHSIKKECLNFMDKWLTLEAVISGVPASTDNLSSLFMDDSNAVLDDLLNSLIKCNNCEF